MPVRAVQRETVPGKERLKKRTRLPKGSSVRRGCGGTRTQSAFQNDAIDHTASVMVFNVIDEHQAEPQSGGVAEEATHRHLRDTSPSHLSSQDRVLGFSHDP